ncbi:hypothetical protein [Corynebacterium callunae]|uniref:hypothetical protein n=1 Tax=Corynebacterium callunae TaxID=1721 RepID=UPI00103EE45A|nr:hypothetical protein [Corynebacterium callunae]MCK2200135.1 hypothetical protein [Corynebacterium callunae]
MSDSTPAADPAKTPGMSPEAILKGTGKSWAEWLELLDKAQGTTMTHTELAAYIAKNFEVSGWWAQGIAIGYEYDRGMRDRGMTSDGYATNASKTFNTPVSTLWQFFADDQLRSQWLEPDLLSPTSATEPKTFNAKWNADNSRISVNFQAKGENKSSFGLQHRRLPSQEHIAPTKAMWKSKIAVLAELIKNSAG